MEFASKLIPLPGGRKAKAQIWDTAGQERYRSISMKYALDYFSQYKKAVGALVVFDVTNRASFKDAEEWAHLVRERASEKVQIVLVGNKTDLTRRAVSADEGQYLAKQMGALYH